MSGNKGYSIQGEGVCDIPSRGKVFVVKDHVRK
jgi:hypothetical protein